MQKSNEDSILSGAIEEDVVQDETGDKHKVYRTFLAKRQIGGKDINGKIIKGWKEVPTVLDWDSTYRTEEFNRNFSKLAQKLKDGDVSDLFHSGDLTIKEQKDNHAMNVFINSFLHDWCRDSNYIYESLELLEEEVVAQNHATKIYLNDDYESMTNTRETIFNDKVVEYDKYNMFTYEQIVEIWMEYLDIMDEMKVYQLNLSGEEVCVIDPEHRWNEQYTNKMLAKFKDLEESDFSDMWTTMLTLTTYQDKSNGEPMLPDDWDKENRGPSWFEAMEKLKDSLRKVLKVLRQVADRELDSKLHYVWIVEAHKTGYPHIHVAIFGDVSEWLNSHTNKLRIKQLLEEEYDLGGDGIATSFDTKPPSGDGAIKSISNYLMKYMKKNFGEIKSKYEDHELSDKDWGALVFNACMFVTGHRTWGTSQEVGSVMKTDETESDKDYVNLGGELTEDPTEDFNQIINSKGNESMKARIKKRNKLRKSIKNRQNV